MAFQTGTATGIIDLYNKLRDFLVADTALVAAGENWTQISGNTGPLVAADQIVLQGPGTTGTDEILVGMETSINATSDYFNLEFSGFTVWNPAIAFANQVNSQHQYTINLWNQPMPYWFVANGRRFIVVVRVSDRYMSAYCGLILPYVLPSLWPYPLFIGASSRQPTWRYSVVAPNMSGFFHPGETNAALLFPDVIWRGVVNQSASGANEQRVDNVNIQPFHFDFSPVRENIDGSYNLEQARIDCSTPYAAQLGALQGVFRVSGFANNAENIVTHGGVDHLVFPNVYRTAWEDFAAIALE